MPRYVYKLLTLDEWSEYEKGGFAGSALDQADGFIHLSTADQVAETAALHYKATGDLKLLAVDTELTGSAMKYEASRGGQLFPHLFDRLETDYVSQVWDLLRGADGQYIFPDDLKQDAP